MKGKTKIYVFADWIGLSEPELMGILMVYQSKGKKAFSFEYEKLWLETKPPIFIDPDIHSYAGLQFAESHENFGVFLDSMPDTWGKTLMKRKEIQNARIQERAVGKLYDIDYLLGVFDHTRMGGLRFKTDLKGPFLDDDTNKPTPPWSRIRELQAAAGQMENDENVLMDDWLNILLAPGSSLGGARPKANVVDEENALWIAKFPSKNDNLNKGAWEYLVYKLAIRSGIPMALSKIEKISGNHHTFFTKRFDRNEEKRIHFASAMTMTGFTEEILRNQTASYLDIVEFIVTRGTNVNENLKQLWRRIVFNIAVSNTDDHLRNHGFILTNNNWELSPAYDLNPSIDKNHLSLNIDQYDNSLDFNLAISVGKYFRLGELEMKKIINEIQQSVADWQKIADDIGISKVEQEIMKPAFSTPFPRFP